MMKKYILVIATLVAMLSSTSTADTNSSRLLDARMDLSVLPFHEVLEYDIAAFTGKEEPIEYGTLVLETTVGKDAITLLDTMSIFPSLSGYAGVTFKRQLRYSTDDLLHPMSVTLDVVSGTNEVREMSWSNGVMTVYGRGDENFPFDNGILTYNAMLRIVRCLRVSNPTHFTIEQYAEPVLFRVRKANEPGDAVLSTASRTDADVASVDEPDFVFRLLSAKIHTEMWLNENSLPVTIVEHIPGGKRLVYSLITNSVPTKP